MRSAFIATAALFLLVAGCLEGGNGPAGGDAEPVEEPMERIDQGQQSGVEGLAERVITTQQEWEAFWQEHRGNEAAEASTPPPVDFTESRVVAVVLEQKPNACYGVQIENVTTRAGETVVSYTVYTPPPDAFCAEVITHPFDIVKIPARDTPVIFEATTQQAPSPGGSESRPIPEEGFQEEPRGVTFERIETEGGSSLQGPVERVLSTEEAWASFWENHTANRSDPPERPGVDFAQHRVAVVITETKPNLCWTMRIENVTQADGETTVHYTVYSPPPDAMCGQVTVQPVDIVKIPADDTVVVFDATERQGPPPQ